MSSRVYMIMVAVNVGFSKLIGFLLCLNLNSYHGNLQQQFWIDTFKQKISCTCSGVAIVDSGTSLLTGLVVCISCEAFVRTINLRVFNFFIFLVSN
uniref:Uncharacterized protein n=1 Tax=Lactuca sativa TaxID=4236 RepID=A0A9R1XXM4_LACSA|nr:hypothetical protein LSAT_V11C100047480 [Lactuca sativa]